MAQYVNGSAAVQLGQEELQQEELQPGRRFTVVPGSRPQHESQTQHRLSPLAVTACKCLVAFGAVFVAAALARTLVLALAFGYSSQNADLRTQLEEERSAGSELEVKLSALGSSDRIVSLAVDAYGMVPAEAATVIDVSASAAAGQAGADGAQTA